MGIIVGWEPDGDYWARERSVKDQYVGDVNDFYKYQLLRVVRQAFDAVLIVWMLTARDGRTDGGRVGYLGDPGSRVLDPELFDVLSVIVESGGRSVSAIEESRILGGCEFVSEEIPLDRSGRAGYFAKLAERLEPGSLVFFDPDNGFEVSSVPKHRAGAERYLFWDELGAIRDAGASTLVYQHFPRVHRGKYLEALLDRLRDEMGDGYRVFASHSSSVAFVFAVRDERASALLRALRAHCDRSAPLSFVEGGPRPAGDGR